MAQAYEFIPADPKRLVVSPKKRVVFIAAMAGVGSGLTDKVSVITESQPLADAMVRVYVFCVVKLWLPKV